MRGSTFGEGSWQQQARRGSLDLQSILGRPRSAAKAARGVELRQSPHAQPLLSYLTWNPICGFGLEGGGCIN